MVYREDTLFYFHTTEGILTDLSTDPKEIMKGLKEKHDRYPGFSVSYRTPMREAISEEDVEKLFSEGEIIFVEFTPPEKAPEVEGDFPYINIPSYSCIGSKFVLLVSEVEHKFKIP